MNDTDCSFLKEIYDATISKKWPYDVKKALVRCRPKAPSQEEVQNNPELFEDYKTKCTDYLIAAGAIGLYMKLGHNTTRKDFSEISYEDFEKLFFLYKKVIEENEKNLKDIESLHAGNPDAIKYLTNIMDSLDEETIQMLYV